MMKDNSARILLVDSDASAAKKLAAKLNSAGFNVFTANNMAMALKLHSSSKPDIILLDASMRDAEGFNVLSGTKPGAGEENIPVIIISSDADLNIDPHDFLSIADDYIVKPFHFAEVLTRINTHLDIRRIKTELEQKNKELMKSNALLQQLVVTDALTGLYNKGYIIERLQTDILHAIRYKEPVSFLIADIDYFKEINDKYGHPAGDAVLKETAGLIKKIIRKVDIAIRYGGEEFLIVCLNTRKSGALKLAERIRKKISSHTFMYKDARMNVTISIGVKSTVFVTQANAEEVMYKLIEDADAALYKAKANGRNRIEEFNEAGQSNNKSNENKAPVNAVNRLSNTNDKFIN